MEYAVNAANIVQHCDTWSICSITVITSDVVDVDWTFSPSIHQFINPSIHQSINPSTNRFPIDLLIVWWSSAWHIPTFWSSDCFQSLIKLSGCVGGHWWFDHSINQSANHLTDQRTNQSINLWSIFIKKYNCQLAVEQSMDENIDFYQPVQFIYLSMITIDESD